MIKKKKKMEKEGKEKTDPDSNPRETECFLTGQY